MTKIIDICTATDVVYSYGNTVLSLSKNVICGSEELLPYNKEEIVLAFKVYFAYHIFWDTKTEDEISKQLTILSSLGCFYPMEEAEKMNASTGQERNGFAKKIMANCKGEWFDEVLGYVDYIYHIAETAKNSINSPGATEAMKSMLIDTYVALAYKKLGFSNVPDEVLAKFLDMYA